MRKYFVILFLFLSTLLNAQSYHFSQFYSTPLLTNPAFTGYIDGPYRVATNYRSQWASGGTPYTTTSLSADFIVLPNRIAEENRLGAGISLLNDKTMDGAVQSNSVGLSTAYNLSLDPDRVHTIGLGFQGVYHERTINFNKLSFENQLTSSGFNVSLPIGENLQSQRKSYFDLNFGSVYNYNMDGKSFFTGLGVYNVFHKTANYLEEEFKMPSRYTFSAGGRLNAGYSGIFYFSLNYQNEAKASETTIGAAYGLQLGSEKKQVINFGIWHRLNDAIIPYIGYQLNGFQTGFSYDYTISQLKTAGQVKSGFEISLLYTAEDKRELKRLIPWY